MLGSCADWEEADTKGEQVRKHDSYLVQFMRLPDQYFVYKLSGPPPFIIQHTPHLLTLSSIPLNFYVASPDHLNLLQECSLDYVICTTTGINVVSIIHAGKATQEAPTKKVD